MTRPGLAKARGLPLVMLRRVVLARVGDARWRELFDAADVVSEGSVLEVGGARTWFGSTSLILLVPATRVAALATLARLDVHARVRALRVACREARVRAPGELGRLAGEIAIGEDPRGVRIDVDVQAPLIERRARTRAP